MLTLHAFQIGHSVQMAVLGLSYFHAIKGVFIALLAPSLVFLQKKGLITVERLLINNQHQLN